MFSMCEWPSQPVRCEYAGTRVARAELRCRICAAPPFALTPSRREIYYEKPPPLRTSTEKFALCTPPDSPRSVTIARCCRSAAAAPLRVRAQAGQSKVR